MTENIIQPAGAEAQRVAGTRATTAGMPVCDTCKRPAHLGRCVDASARETAALSGVAAPAGAVQQPNALNMSKALRRAFKLGQTYWQQADSESYAENKRSDETLAKFNALVEEMDAALSGAPAGAEPLTDAEVALLDRILEDFADCGETNEGHDVLLDFARRGYLECQRYAPTKRAHQAIEAWLAHGIGSTCEKGDGQHG